MAYKNMKKQHRHVRELHKTTGLGTVHTLKTPTANAEHYAWNPPKPTLFRRVKSFLGIS